MDGSCTSSGSAKSDLPACLTLKYEAVAKKNGSVCGLPDHGHDDIPTAEPADATDSRCGTEMA